MKRSEMVKLLNNILFPKDGSFSTPDAGTVLFELEKLGMLPPRAEFELSGQKCVDYFWESEE